MKVNFYLKSTKETERLIYLFASFNGQRLKYSTGRKIEVRLWNEKANTPKQVKGNSLLTQYLNDLKAEVLRLEINTQLANEVLTTDKVKAHLDSYTNRTERNDKLKLTGHLQTFVDLYKATKRHNTAKKFVSLINHLNAYQTEKKVTLNFQGMDLMFYDSFTQYLSKKGLQSNSISTLIRGLKTFLTWASDRGLNKYSVYKKFKAPETEQNIIHLSQTELMQFYATELPDRLERIKDSFVFCCYTGLRFSDLMQVNRDRIKGNTLHITTEKTNDNTTIPLTEIPLQILYKYDYQLPVISNQKANEYLKEAAKLAELTDKVELKESRGAKVIKKTYEKHQVISWHDSRKTFVTLSLEMGIPAEVIMKISNHKQHKVFRKYLAITDKVKEKEMQKFNQLSKLKAV